MTSQNIVDGCYQGTALNANLCNLFTRNTDPASAQFGGFNFLRTVDINFAKLKTSGIDFSASYDFSLGAHGFRVTVVGTDVEELDFFTNPADHDDVNPELGEIRRPELAGNIYLRWNWGRSERQLAIAVSGRDVAAFSGSRGLRRHSTATSSSWMRPWLHDLNVSYVISEAMMLHGGVRNVTREEPFATDRAFPASPRGRMIYLGGRYRLRNSGKRRK